MLENALETAYNMAAGQSTLSTGQEDVVQTEEYLSKNYNFRFNVLSNKVEYQSINPNTSSSHEKIEVAVMSQNDSWNDLNDRVLNSIILRAKLAGISKSDPSKNIERYIHSTSIATYNPALAWLSQLPEWDGINRIAELFGRIPGITTKQILWCNIWFRGLVAQWMQLNKVHGNEIVPVFIGKQGSGKTTFCNRLLPEELRMYFLDHINFDSKFDSDMALTNNLLVNIDEFDRFNARKQADLKQTLSRVSVNSRPIYGSIEVNRPRFASFTATTNDQHPLADTTGSRRFICIRVSGNNRLDYESPIDYQQIYAQAVYELKHGERYWLTQEETFDLEQSNLPCRKTDAFEEMILNNFHIAEDTENVKPLLLGEVIKILQEVDPNMLVSHSLKIKIGSSLKMLGCKVKHSNRGQMYYLLPYKK